MDEISVEELQRMGYVEDPTARRKLEAPYGIVTIPSVLVFLCALALTAVQIITLLLGLVLIVSSTIAILLAVVIMYKSHPVSEQTGKRLSKYRNSKPGPGVFMEMIYVCHDSKRFFTRVYAEDPDGPYNRKAG